MFVSKTRQYISSNKHPFASVVGSISSGSQPFLYRDDANTSRETSLSSSGGLIALLVGRLTGSDASSPRVSQHLRDLGKIVELVNTAISLHKCLVDHDDVRGATSQEAPLDPLAVREQNSFGLSHHDKNQCETGNKLATLSADVLLAAVSSLLAGFDCPQVVDILSGAMSDMVDAEFLPLSASLDHQTAQITLSYNPRDEWLTYVSLSKGSMLASSCQSAVLLSVPNMSMNTGPGSEFYSRIESQGLAAREFGNLWAILTRLIDEKDYIDRLMLQKNVTPDVRISDSAPLGFLEGGLFQPSLLDSYKVHAFKTKQSSSSGTFSCSSPTRVEQVLLAYNEIGGELLDRLRRALDRLLTYSGCLSGEKFIPWSHPPHGMQQKIDIASVMSDMVAQMSNDISKKN